MSKVEINKRYYEKHKDKIKQYGLSQKGKYVSYKSDAKRRGIEFNLTEEEFLKYWQQDCYYCSSAIATIGLDRVDSSIGYSADNIVACCFSCNEMKNNKEEEEWYNKMLTILKHRGII